MVARDNRPAEIFSAPFDMTAQVSTVMAIVFLLGSAMALNVALADGALTILARIYTIAAILLAGAGWGSSVRAYELGGDGISIVRFLRRRNIAFDQIESITPIDFIGRENIHGLGVFPGIFGYQKNIEIDGIEGVITALSNRIDRGVLIRTAHYSVFISPERAPDFVRSLESILAK